MGHCLLLRKPALPSFFVTVGDTDAQAREKREYLQSLIHPEVGLALLIGIDPLLDMGRSATNVVGNSLATAVISKWENALEDKPAL